MRKLLALLVAVLFVFTACGDSGGGDPGSIDSCDGLVAEAMDLIQIVLDEIGDLSLEDLQAFDENPPESISNLETRGAELEARSDELDCTEAELAESFEDRVGSLKADGQFAEFFLDAIRSEGNPFTSGG